MGLSENRIPEDKLPQCWSDDVRMNALFAPFRLKSANPESWEMKMKFWSDMLRQWCRCKSDPVISAADAKFTFQRKGRTPACIDIVTEEMFRNGELSPMSKYQQILHNGPEGWVRWGARLAFKPAAFALTAVSSLLPGKQTLDNDGLPKASIDSTQRFVLESAVKEQATELLENYPTGVERIGTIDELMKNCEFQQSRETFEVLLGYLVSQGHAVKKDDIVKIADPNKKVSSITETDEALAKLLTAETRLECDATKLSREVASAECEAKAALKLGNRIQAKNHLRRKHKLQTRLDRCEVALRNVQQLLQQMREIDVNAAIVDTYRMSSQAMKQGMKQNGLSEDSVLDTMDDLKDVMDQYNEVEKALAGSPDDLDAAELEEELKELLSGGSAGGGTPGKEERKEPKLPSPPMKSPSTRRTSEVDYVFDGEERMIEELNKLSVEDASPKVKSGVKIAVTEGWGADESSKAKPSKPWYPPSAKCLQTSWGEGKLDASLRSFVEADQQLKQDQRLHPGQPLDVDFTAPPTLYAADFQVRDHTLTDGVWLFNRRDDNGNLSESTSYISLSTAGNSSSGTFEMAPGGERKHPQPWMQEEDTSTVEQLEERLRNLRGFNL